MELRRLRADTQGAVRRLTLSGQPLTTQESLELAWAAGQLAEDRSVHVVVLDSAGDDFCPGPADDLDPLALGIDPAAAVASLRPPVVVALRGRAASVGLELALAGDVRVAEPSATLSIPDVVDGRLPCWGGTQRLARTIGRPQALRLLLLGDLVDAREAVALGLVHEIGGRDRVEEIVGALTRLGPLALEYAKEAVLAGSELTMRDGLRLEADLGLLLQASRDRAEGIAAFLEKRAPEFEGR